MASTRDDDDDDDDRAVAPTDPAESVLPPMANQRPGEPAGWKLARARMLGSLFGGDSTLGTFGRFRVLERLGAGGMGVVYEAYDPDLARGVALKLVNVAGKDRETAFTEAQALAQLSHPNVVPIHDVGLDGDHVYLVMELVRGDTLRRWCADRTVREILSVYHQAGSALAAAHAVGLVHRDFKPENAIVGKDGRVRVIDFGLACEADDPARSAGGRHGIAGTPGFMAPEITAGAAITPAADQYSFCVALGDALGQARRPPPRRIAALLARGRAAEPAERFPSMRDLLHALARDPARTWRRGSAAGSVLVTVGAIMFAIGRLPGEPDLCDAGAAPLDAVWRPDLRAIALARVGTLGSYGRSLQPRLERDLDAHRASWGEANRAACLDRTHHAETEAQSERRATCLQRGTDALSAVADLMGHIDAPQLEQLPRAVQSLPDAAACSDPRLLASNIAPPPKPLRELIAQVRREIAQARIGVAAGRYEQALAEAQIATRDAGRVGYPPVLAEALLVEGHARMSGDHEAAMSVLAEATRVALASSADALAVEAWARRAWLQGTWTSPSGALAGVEVIEPIAERDPAAAFARALFYNNVGSVELARNDRDRAHDYFARALTASRKVTGDGALELLAIRANIGLSSDDRVHGDKLLAEVAAESTGLLGAEHPDTLTFQLLRGISTVEDLAQAADLVAPTCQLFEQHAALARRTAECWLEVGLLRWDLVDRAPAIAAVNRAAQLQGAGEAAGYLTLLRGDAAGAARQFAAALAAAAPGPDDQWWDRLSRARLSLGLGRAQRAAGQLAAARTTLETAIAALEQIIEQHPATAYERRLGRARVELAFALSAMGARLAERRAATEAALAWLERVGAPASERDQLTMALGPAR